MNLRDVNWRFALYSAGLLGGVLWAVLASLVVGYQNAIGTAQFTVASGAWLWIVGVSLVLLLIGAVVTVLSRSIILRSIGIGMAICALSGWVMIAWIAVQALLGAF